MGDGRTAKEKLKRLSSLIQTAEKTYGKGSIMLASEAEKQGKLSKRLIPTPSFSLNEALHCKGFGGIVELHGDPGCGKTYLSLDTIVKAQKEDPSLIAGWLETEGSITKDILAERGVDLSRLLFWRQEDVGSAEDALDIARGVISSGDVDMLVINSLAGLCPKTEVEDDLEKQNIALTARLMSKFLRVSNGAISKNNMVVIFINQERTNVGVMYGNPNTTPGGKALRFYASQRIAMRRNKIQASDPIDKNERDNYMKISYTVEKNRFALGANPITNGAYYAKYSSGIDSIITMPSMLVQAGILRQSGAYLYYEDAGGNIYHKDGVPLKWKSKNDLINSLRNDERLCNLFMSKLSGTGAGTESATQEQVEAIRKEDEAAADEITQEQQEQEE